LPCKEVMAVRMGRFPQRAAKEFARNLSWLLVSYALIAAILTLSAVAPLGGVLLFGGVFVLVMAAVITVLVLWGGDDEARLGDDSGWRDASAYHPGHAHPEFFAGDSYYGDGGDSG
jgi:hypothetical protein